MIDQEIEDRMVREWEFIIQGGTTDFNIFRWIEYCDWLDEKWLNENEMEICKLWDSIFFECEECNWVMSVGSESYKTPNVCTDCDPDD